jgi:small subunit ribosomal protein S3
MGQKVNPIGFRLGVNRTWDSRWFADGAEYAKLLHEDFRIREYLRENLKQAGISRIIIERPHKKCRVTIYSARPGCCDRQEGCRHRKPAPRRLEDDRLRSAPEHR